MTYTPGADLVRMAAHAVPVASDNLRDLADALDDLADVFGDTMTADQVGHLFTCGEAEIIARVMRLTGHRDAAEHWLDLHAQNEEDGDDTHRGRWLRGRVLARYGDQLRAAMDAGRMTTDEVRAKAAAADERTKGRPMYADLGD